jgi:hypothetical protein
MVRFGRHYTKLMPDCGCDHCFEEDIESADRLIEELEFHLRAVSESRYIERFEDTGPLYVRFSVSAERWHATEQSELLPAADIEQPADGWVPWFRRAT